MGELTVTTFLTLDGVMQAPGGPEEDPTGGFAHGGWTVNYWDDVMSQVMSQAMGGPFDLLLGRKTYDIFAGYWPNQGDDDPIAATAALLAAGKTVAIKGLGGYHLACDASNDDAVSQLRARKHREDRPFALMVTDAEAAIRSATWPRSLSMVRFPCSMAGFSDETGVPALIADLSAVISEIFLVVVADTACSALMSPSAMAAARSAARSPPMCARIWAPRSTTR